MSHRILHSEAVGRGTRDNLVRHSKSQNKLEEHQWPSLPECRRLSDWIVQRRRRWERGEQRETQFPRPKARSSGVMGASRLRKTWVTEGSGRIGKDCRLHCEHVDAGCAVGFACDCIEVTAGWFGPFPSIYTLSDEQRGETKGTFAPSA